jgi:hypothetical protein
LRELIEPSLVADAVRKHRQEGARRISRPLLSASLRGTRFLPEREALQETGDHLTPGITFEEETQIRILHNLFDILFLKYSDLPRSSLVRRTRNIRKYMTPLR